MQRLGYGPEKRLAVTLSTRNVEGYRDAAVIAISQLTEASIDAQLEVIETANWFPRVIRKDYTVGVTVSEGGLDEPDQKFYETYLCAADRNYPRLLQSRNRRADRSAVYGSRSGEAPQLRLGYRPPARAGCLPTGAVVFTVCDLRAAAAQRTDQQPLQWLPYGRRMARKIAR